MEKKSVSVKAIVASRMHIAMAVTKKTKYVPVQLMALILSLFVATRSTSAKEHVISRVGKANYATIRDVATAFVAPHSISRYSITVASSHNPMSGDVDDVSVCMLSSRSRDRRHKRSLKQRTMGNKSCVYSTQNATQEAGTTTETKNVFERHFEQVNNVEPKMQSNSVVLTYLEHNGWIMSFKEVNLLIDPILEGSLDFGLPSGIYEAKRQQVLPLTGMALDNIDRIDALIITQGLDDHAHLKTLTKLSQVKSFQSIPIIAPPSAKSVLEESGLKRNVQYINHGNVVEIGKNTSKLKVRATTGALVGPPWQKRENGYIFEDTSYGSVYLEPHVEFNRGELTKLAPVDVVISPIVGQQIDPLGGYKIVQGPSSTIDLVKVLQPKYLIPMNNGDLESIGVLNTIVSQVGNKEEVPNSLPRNTQFISIQPGQPIVLPN